MKGLYTLFIILILLPITVHSQYWKEIKNIPPAYINTYWLDVYFHPSNPNLGWVCGFNGQVIRTTDGGNSWLGTSILGVNHLEHVQFPTFTTGYTSGPDGIYKSTDGGVNWSNITPDINFDYWGCYFITENVGLVLGGGCGTNQRFYRTTDGGANWTLFTANQPQSGLTDLIIYEENGLSYAVSSGKLWRSSDGGKTWAVFASSGTNVWQEELTKYSNSFLLPFAGTNCSGQGIDGGMRFSTDMGTSWNEYHTGYPMFGAYLLDEQRGWACGDNESIYYTSNAGITWTKKNCGMQPNADLDDIWFINENLGFVVGHGVYKLNPPEYIFSKDSLIFENMCINENKTDSLTLENLSFDITYAQISITDDALNSFKIISPVSNVNVQPCDLMQIKVLYTPKNDGVQTAKLKIKLHPTNGADIEKVIELVGYVLKSTAFPQDTLIVIDSLYCNTFKNVTIPWFTENIKETITDYEKIIQSGSILLTSSIPFTINKPVSNLSFQVQLLDTGWNIARFKFTTEPCTKDTFITIKAYGYSPVIKHASKSEISSSCLNPVLDTIRIYNYGNFLLNIGNVSITPPSNEFSIVGWVKATPPVRIKPEEFEDLIISYHPAASGTHIAQISIQNNDSTKVNGNKNPYYINLRGVSRAAKLSDTLVVDFGDVCFNDVKEIQKYLYNHGNLDANYKTFSNQQFFTITFPDAFRIVKKDDSIKINIKFTAGKKGLITETLELRASPCDDKTYIILKANVISNDLAIDPVKITGLVKMGETLTKSVKVTSLSLNDINISSIRFEPEPTDWTYTFLPQIPILLLAKQSVNFNFSFTPHNSSVLKGRIVIETDGLCSETYYVDVELSSFNRFVQVNPEKIDFGLNICSIENKILEAEIINKGFDADSISEITLSPASTNFTILNMPKLPLLLQPEEKYVVRIEFNSHTEGVFNTELNIKTDGSDGQTFLIPVKAEFRKSNIIPKVQPDLNFGDMEICTPPKTINFEFENTGTLDDTLTLIGLPVQEMFTANNPEIVVLAGSKSTASITVNPEMFLNLGLNIHTFKYESKVCPDEFTVNVNVNFVEQEFTLTPPVISYGSKFTEQDIIKTVSVKNIGSIPFIIESVNLSDTQNFRILQNIAGIDLLPGDKKDFEVEFIGRNAGTYNSDILLVSKSDCLDSAKVEFDGIVNDESYSNLVYINRYESVAGNSIDISVYLKDSTDSRVIPDRIDFRIDFDERLFYPAKIQSRYGNGLANVKFNYKNGSITGFVENEYSHNLLRDSGEIFRISGVVLASIPDSTTLFLNQFKVTTDKPLNIERKDGFLKLIDYCENTVVLGQLMMMPKFTLNAGTIAANGKLNIEISSTSDLKINYSALDISGEEYKLGSFISTTEKTGKEINFYTLPSGTYFIIFKSKYQSEMLKILNVK